MFARLLGVTPHTVYRWELPEDAKDARRPRGAELAKLVMLASGESLEPSPTGVAVGARGSAGPARVPRSDRRVPLEVGATHDDVMRVMPTTRLLIGPP